MLNFATNLAVNNFGNRLPDWAVYVLLACSVIPFFVWAIIHEKSLKSRVWIKSQFTDRPISSIFLLSVFAFAIILQTFRIVKHSRNSATRPSAAEVKPPPPSPQEKQNHPLLERPSLIQTAKKGMSHAYHPKIKALRNVPPSANEGPTVGDESVAMGRLAPGTKIGDKSVVLGATDNHGNAIYDKPGAYGYGACATPGNLAIGANANAGCPQTPITTAPKPPEQLKGTK
jgi:hypothetical protein